MNCLGLVELFIVAFKKEKNSLQLQVLNRGVYELASLENGQYFGASV